MKDEEDEEDEEDDEEGGMVLRIQGQRTLGIALAVEARVTGILLVRMMLVTAAATAAAAAKHLVKDAAELGVGKCEE